MDAQKFFKNGDTYGFYGTYSKKNFVITLDDYPVVAGTHDLEHYEAYGKDIFGGEYRFYFEETDMYKKALEAYTYQQYIDNGDIETARDYAETCDFFNPEKEDANDFTDYAEDEANACDWSNPESVIYLDTRKELKDISEISPSYARKCVEEIISNIQYFFSADFVKGILTNEIVTDNLDKNKNLSYDDYGYTEEDMSDRLEKEVKKAEEKYFSEWIKDYDGIDRDDAIALGSDWGKENGVYLNADDIIDME